MKKLIYFVFILLCLSSCTQQKHVAYNPKKRPHDYVFVDLNRKPMSQRTKYQRPMRESCYAAYHNALPGAYVKPNRPKRTKRFNLFR